MVDLGADFRLRSTDAWANFYGGEHAGTWTYGLPELPEAREQVCAATRVANPGCYPTAVALALAPLAQAGAIEPTDIVVVAASGTSGAGRKASDSLLATNVMGSMAAYKVGGIHQHTPEMEQSIAVAGGWEIGDVALSFTPLLGPDAPRHRCYLHCNAHRSRSIRAPSWTTPMRTEPFVTVLPEGQWPHTGSVAVPMLRRCRWPLTSTPDGWSWFR